MRTTLVASVIALAALVGSAHLAACAVNSRTAPAHAITRMAQAPLDPKADFWFIRGVVEIDGKTANTQFIEPNEDGKPMLVIFDSKDSCDTALVEDSNIIETLAKFRASVAEAGGTVVVTCEKFVPAGEPA